MKKIAVLISVFILVLISGCATTDSVPVSGSAGNFPWEKTPFEASWDELSAASESLKMEGEQGVRILLSEGRFEFRADGSLESTYKWVYQIIDQSGIDNWSSTQIGWTPWNQEKPVIKARVTNPDGNSYFLTDDHIIESTEQSDLANIYSDRKLLQAPFPRVTVGSIIEEETTVVNSVPAFGTGLSRTWYFEGSNPIAMSRVRVDVPGNLPFSYKTYLKEDFEPVVSKNSGVRTYVFEYSSVPAAEETEQGLSIHHPHWVSLEFTSGVNWKKMAEVYSELVEEQLSGSDSLLARIDNVPAGNAHAAAVKITQWLNRQIRYTGLELGSGSIIPTKPEVTLDRGFGDCKDKAVIVTGMMRAAGYEAYVALLRAGTSRDVDPDLPGIGGFNHAIVYVAGDNPFWIDPTSEFAYDGYLPLGDQNRWALVASPDTTGLMKTSSSGPEDNLTVREIEYFLKDSGFADLVETTTYYGADDSLYRNRYLFAKEEDMDESIDDYIARTYRFGDNTGFTYSGTDDFTKPFSVELKIEGAGRGVTEESQAVAAIMQGELVNHLPDVFRAEPDEEDPPRENEYYFYKPFTFEARYIINPPAGFSLREVPEPETIKLGSVTVEKRFESEDGVLTADLKISTGDRVISPEDFELTREKVIEFSEKEPIIVTYEHIGEKLLAEGDYRGSIDFMKRMTLDEPDKEIHQIRLAEALLKAGLGLDAREAAEKAVSINGDSAKAYSKLGWVLQHDDLGRRFGPGYDREGAAAAYEKAIELDPDEWTNHANLAILLEYDENGLRYRKGDLEEAVARYEAVEDEIIENRLYVNVITDLLYLQDWEKLSESLDNIDDQTTVYTYKTAIAAASGDIARAIETASRSGNAEEKRSVLAGAGDLLTHIRKYGAAASLLKEAARGSANAPSLESRATVLAKTRASEELVLNNSDPEDLVKSFYIELYTSDGKDFTSLKSILGPEVYRRAVDEKSSNNLHSEWWAVRNESVSSGLSMESILDLMLSDIRFQIRNDSNGGYHLKLIQTGLATNLDSNFYIRKMPEGLRIVGMDSFREPAGLVIMDFIEKGELSSAAEWLDWFLKDYSVFSRNSDDPLYGHPLQNFWKKRGNDTQDSELLRLAAASILVTDDRTWEKGAEILENSTVTGYTEGINYALYFAYQTGDNFEGQLKVTSSLYDEYPESNFAWSVYLRSLLNLEKYGELEKLASERLAEDPEDDTATDMLMNSHFNQLDFASVDRIFEDLRNRNRLSARLYNTVAWMYLFKPETDARALDYARQAVKMSNSQNTAILHTLSALYAEFGRCEEARNTLDKVMSLSGSNEPSSDDWYVLGRIAEEYGMLDSARIYYGKVEIPESEASKYDSSYVLARRRLEGLQ